MRMETNVSQLLGSLVCVAILLLNPVAVFADEPSPTAKLGELAPPLQISQWIKGGPINMAEGKGNTVYVLDFWTTGCSPCVGSVPFYTHIQKRYKDKKVVVIGISNESANVVRYFTNDMGDKMSYVVAVDDNGKTFAAYLDANGLRGVPHTFIVDTTGAVICMDLSIEFALPKVLSGDYTPEQAKQDGERIEKIHESVTAYMTLAKGGHTTAADEVGKSLVSTATEFPNILNKLAWQILTDDDLKIRDEALALRAAQAAYDATQGKDAQILDTYALALFKNGQVQAAIRHQKEVLEMIAKDPLWREIPQIHAQAKARLEQFQANTPNKN